MISYQQINDLPLDYIKKSIEYFLAEDAPNGDKTSLSCVPENRLATAEIQAVNSLVFAGEKIIPAFFGDDFEIKVNYEDGEQVAELATIAVIRGNARELLLKERTLLNLIQRCCGIATLTKQYVDLAAPKDVKILDTRKTMPGLRQFDKYAVQAGGGTNHRLDLSNGILIKDNHIKAAGGIKSAVENSRKYAKGMQIELEIDTFDQLREGLDAKADGFLLDNMTPKQIREAVAIIRSHPNGMIAFVEASGGINLSNIEPYLTTGIDAISIGALTHSAKNADIRMEFRLED